MMLRGWLVGLFCCGTAFSATICPAQPTSLTVYTDPTFTCTLGPFTISAFSFSASLLAGNQALLTSDQIQVTPVYKSDSLSFNFSGNFIAAPGNSVQYVIGYLIDPPPDIIRGGQIDLDFSDPATLLTMFCEGAAFQAGGCPALAGVHFDQLQTNGVSPLLLFPSPVHILGVINQATLDATGSATPVSFLAMDNLTALSAEPGSLAMAGIGLVMLLGISAFRVRAKRGQVLRQFGL